MSELISNPRDNHGFGQLKERQYLQSSQKWNAFENWDPEFGMCFKAINVMFIFAKAA